jgi:hypothetical protein
MLSLTRPSSRRQREYKKEYKNMKDMKDMKDMKGIPDYASPSALPKDHHHSSSSPPPYSIVNNYFINNNENHQNHPQKYYANQEYSCLRPVYTPMGCNGISSQILGFVETRCNDPEERILTMPSIPLNPYINPYINPYNNPYNNSCIPYTNLCNNSYNNLCNSPYRDGVCNNNIFYPEEEEEEEVMAYCPYPKRKFG